MAGEDRSATPIPAARHPAHNSATSSPCAAARQVAASPPRGPARSPNASTHRPERARAHASAGDQRSSRRDSRAGNIWGSDANDAAQASGGRSAGSGGTSTDPAGPPDDPGRTPGDPGSTPGDAGSRQSSIRFAAIFPKSSLFRGCGKVPKCSAGPGRGCQWPRTVTRPEALRAGWPFVGPLPTERGSCRLLAWVLILSAWTRQVRDTHQPLRPPQVVLSHLPTRPIPVALR